jgi:hypothetical protein
MSRPDYAREVRQGLTDARRLCGALGLLDGARPNGNGLLIRCPLHGEHEASCGVTLGADGTLRFRCFACQESGDAFTLIAKVRGRNTTNQDDWIEVLAEGAEIAGLAWLADEIRGGEPAEDREQRLPPPPPPLPEPEYPPADEVQWIWDGAQGLETDLMALAYLTSRCIDGRRCSERALLRVLGPSQHLTPWAGTRRAHGDGPCERTWVDSGHRIITRVWDEHGACRSVRSWLCDKSDGWTPKRLPPAGHRASGLVLANRAAVGMLMGKSSPRALVISEGEPDWVTWSERVPESTAVLGILSGSWGPGFAAKVPGTTEVLVRTHCDSAGDRYAKAIMASLVDRCPVWRLRRPESVAKRDDNDLAQEGRLGNDPAVGCAPENEAARKRDEDRARILTVRELLLGSQKRATSQVRPKALTTGHWKVDQHTGGILPGFTWLVAGDTSWGKTTWSIAVADENIRKGARVLIVSLEDDESLYGDRLMARRARVNATRLRDRQLNAEELTKVAGVVQKSEQIPAFLDGRPYAFERLITEIGNAIDDLAIDLVILDYIQEGRTRRRYADDRRMFKEMARSFRHCVKARKRAGIILSQLTLEDECKAPTKQQVRDCRDMAHGAEVIVLGWTPSADVVDKDNQVIANAGERVLKVAKAKNGTKGMVPMSWDEESASFNAVYSREYSIPGFDPEPEYYDTVWSRAEADSADYGFEEASRAGY